MLKFNIKDSFYVSGFIKNQFAKKCKIGYPAACALYNGITTSNRFDTLEAICKTLNCTPNDILVSDDPNFINTTNKSDT